MGIQSELCVSEMNTNKLNILIDKKAIILFRYAGDRRGLWTQLIKQLLTS